MFKTHSHLLVRPILVERGADEQPTGDDSQLGQLSIELDRRQHVVVLKMFNFTKISHLNLNFKKSD